jgi:voltage-gated potassium channel
MPLVGLASGEEVMAGHATPLSTAAEGSSAVGWLRRAGEELARYDWLPAIIGIAVVFAGTVPRIAEAHDRLITLICATVAAVFAAEYAWRLIARLPARSANGESVLRAMFAGPAALDLLAAAPLPIALAAGIPGETARLLGILWALKLLRVNPAFALLGRVLRNEGQALLSVSLAFLVVLLFAGTLMFLAERAAQPDAYGSIPDALWWGIATLTTTGYGDKVPATLAGRLLAGAVMVAGIGLFALWAGILASGFAQELRRREFLQSWNLVVRLPLFRDLGAAALAEIAQLLKAERWGAGHTIVREGQPGDSMYFIAEGDVEVRARAGPITLKAGGFFGEMALVLGAPRNATVVALGPVRLLRLDVVDFRGLAARLPELLRLIEEESERRRGAASR